MSLVYCSERDFIVTAAHVVTEERATTLSIHRVVELATKGYNKEMGNKIHDLYDFLKTNYNNYVKLMRGTVSKGEFAAVKQEDKACTIADDIPLLRFLSGWLL